MRDSTWEQLYAAKAMHYFRLLNRTSAASHCHLRAKELHANRRTRQLLTKFTRPPAVVAHTARPFVLCLVRYCSLHQVHFPLLYLLLLRLHKHWLAIRPYSSKTRTCLQFTLVASFLFKLTAHWREQLQQTLVMSDDMAMTVCFF